MLDSLEKFFSLSLVDLGVYDVLVIVLFILSLILTIIFSLVALATKVRKISNNIQEQSNDQISNNRVIMDNLDIIIDKLSPDKAINNISSNTDIRTRVLARNNFDEHEDENVRFAKPEDLTTLGSLALYTPENQLPKEEIRKSADTRDIADTDKEQHLFQHNEKDNHAEDTDKEQHLFQHNEKDNHAEDTDKEQPVQHTQNLQHTQHDKKEEDNHIEDTDKEQFLTLHTENSVNIPEGDNAPESLINFNPSDSVIREFEEDSDYLTNHKNPNDPQHTDSPMKNFPKPTFGANLSNIKIPSIDKLVKRDSQKPRAFSSPLPYIPSSLKALQDNVRLGNSLSSSFNKPDRVFVNNSTNNPATNNQAVRTQNTQTSTSYSTFQRATFPRVSNTQNPTSTVSPQTRPPSLRPTELNRVNNLGDRNMMINQNPNSNTQGRLASNVVNRAQRPQIASGRPLPLSEARGQNNFENTYIRDRNSNTIGSNQVPVARSRDQVARGANQAPVARNRDQVARGANQTPVARNRNQVVRGANQIPVARNRDQVVRGANQTPVARNRDQIARGANQAPVARNRDQVVRGANQTPVARNRDQVARGTNQTPVARNRDQVARGTNQTPVARNRDQVVRGANQTPVARNRNQVATTRGTTARGNSAEQSSSRRVSPARNIASSPGRTKTASTNRVAPRR